MSTKKNSLKNGAHLPQLKIQTSVHLLLVNGSSTEKIIMNNPYQNYTPSLDHLVNQLNEAVVREADEFNQLLDLVSTLEIANLELSKNNSILTRALKDKTDDYNQAISETERLIKGTTQVKKNAEEHMVMLQQSQREKAQANDKLDKAMLTIAGYKQIGTPKKIRDQIKAYKEKAAINVSTINSLKSDLKGYRKDISTLGKANQELRLSLSQSNITTTWSNGGDHLMIFPAPLTMSINGKAEKQLTLLFMNQSGCGKLIGIDEEGEPLLCKMPAGGLKPKKATLEKAGMMLRKFRKQNWNITHQDMLSLKDN